MRMREAASAVPAMAMPMLVQMMANWQECALYKYIIGCQLIIFKYMYRYNNNTRIEIHERDIDTR